VFKDLRKEWKAKKKEEEATRKADEERHRASVQQRAHEGGAHEPHVYGQMLRAIGVPGQPPQLPPTGYEAAASGNNTARQYNTASLDLLESMAQYATTYPQSPYGQNWQMYQQNH